MVSTLDLLVLAVLLGGGAYFLKTTLRSPTTDKFTAAMTANVADNGGSSDDSIVAKMAKNKKNVVVFYGSQTGTAEDLASKMAKELAARFGLKAMTADLEDYELDCLSQIPEETLVVFMMASYGEGEPTDNAANFWNFIMEETPEFAEREDGSSDEEKPLSNLHYAVFGLGNSTYEKYNEVGRELNKQLEKLGGVRVGKYGEGDDGTGTMEEDYLAWKEDFMNTLKTTRKLEEKDYVYEPAIKVVDQVDLSVDDPSVYLGEPNKNHLNGTPKAPFTATNPYLSPVKDAHELFNDPARHCVHMEFDVEGANLRYTTGDHLAFWCQNPTDEVERFLKAFELTGVRNDVFDIQKLDSTATVRFPRPTTYDTVVRHFLEINGPVSRQVLSNLVGFAPTPEAKEHVRNLSSNKEKFANEVAARGFSLARLLLTLSGGKPWNVPFSFIIENIPHLQPRYYSISSSSGENPNTISITAVVERQRPAGSDFDVTGVATNNIFDLMHALGKPAAHSPAAQSAYALDGPRDSYTKSGLVRAPIHVRHSNFKLPAKATTPIIMVGPGTGVAPFRGFVRERAHVAAEGKPVGKALLFFGCRRSDQDFLYQKEWSAYTDPSTVGKSEGPFDGSNFLELSTAFSRETGSKVYVQQRMKENAKLINTLLEQGAYFYVCGDAGRMAREVLATLHEIIAKERNISLPEAERVTKKMRSRNLLQEDVW